MRPDPEISGVTLKFEIVTTADGVTDDALTGVEGEPPPPQENAERMQMAINSWRQPGRIGVIESSFLRFWGDTKSAQSQV